MKKLSFLLIPLITLLVSACSSEPSGPVYGGAAFGGYGPGPAPQPGYYWNGTVYVQGVAPWYHNNQYSRNVTDVNSVEVNRTNVNNTTVNNTNVNNTSVNNRTLNRRNVNQTNMNQTNVIKKNVIKKNVNQTNVSETSKRKQLGTEEKKKAAAKATPTPAP